MLRPSPQEAGPHAITWDGKDLEGRRVASGVYLYQVRAGDLVETKRMALAR
jgi:flagellar hook assembly protein FlgD